jgi:hypothetical protein
MATTLEHFSVEMFYEIFHYLQLHEVCHSFSNLNMRFDGIVTRMPLISIYLGWNGMNMTLTQFYYKCLSQPDACHRLLSLCVSDSMSIDSGVWLGTHIHMFVALRHLSLIDIKRTCFEVILDGLSPDIPLVTMNLRFSSYYRAAHTFQGVPEGAYHERLFRSLPMLRVCHLGFWRYICDTMDSRLILPIDATFISIEMIAQKLQTVVLRECSPAFLAHLVRRLPQLQKLRFQFSRPWLPDTHPVTIHDNR